MTKEENRISALRHRAYTAASPADVRSFLMSLEAGGENSDISLDQAAELRVAAFITLKQVSIVAPQDAYDLLLNRLVPWCLNPQKKTTKASIHAYRCRELLGEWINELPSSEVSSILPSILKILIKHLKGRSFNEACWSLTDVGYRDPDLLNILKSVAVKDHGEKGDQALALLIDLGMPQAEIEKYSDELLNRLKQRKYYLTYNLLQFANARAALKVLEMSIGDENNSDSQGRNELINIIARIAQNSLENTRVNNQAAKLLQQVYAMDKDDIAPRLAIQGNILPVVNSTLVARLFADMLLELAPNVDKHIHAIYVRTLRMRESVYPLQLQGVPEARSISLENMLKSVLLLSKDDVGDFGSLLYDAKEHALWAALAYESIDSLTWLAEVLKHEPEGYVQRSLMDVFACFRIDKLPDQLLDWIQDVYDVKRSDHAGDWIVRTAALRVARSAATDEAFQALLNPGFTFDGNVMLDTVQALSDVAIELTNDHARRNEIAETLFQNLRSPECRPRFSASVRAILSLANNGRLPAQLHEQLLDSAFHNEYEDFEQGLLISALVGAKVSLSKVHVEQLHEFAASRNDRLGDVALESLVRLDLLKLSPGVDRRLGLKKTNGCYRWTKGGKGGKGVSEWAPFFIGLLFDRFPNQFMPALLDVLNLASWEQRIQVYGILRRVASKSWQQVPKEVREAIVSRLSKSVTSSSAELNLFFDAARIAPEEFLLKEWQDLVEDWFVDARVEFAEGIRACISKKISDKAKRGGIKHLIHLAEDSQFGVRRSAFRALAELDDSTLLAMIYTWQRAVQHEARIWAAEATEWINIDLENKKDICNTITSLSVDPHKLVRKALDRASQSRRQRNWAKEYLGRLSQLRNPSNRQMLTVWRYGWALARIGDDDTLNELEKISNDQSRPPNLRHFASLLHKDAKKHWEERRKKWPDPILSLKGRVEAGTGKLSVEGNDHNVEYILWCEPAERPDGHSSWGGRFRLTKESSGDQLFGKEGQIHTEDGRTGEGLVQSWENFTELVFCGDGEYPDIKK